MSLPNSHYFSFLFLFIRPSLFRSLSLFIICFNYILNLFSIFCILCFLCFLSTSLASPCTFIIPLCLSDCSSIFYLFLCDSRFPIKSLPFPYLFQLWRMFAGCANFIAQSHIKFCFSHSMLFSFSSNFTLSVANLTEIHSSVLRPFIQSIYSPFLCFASVSSSSSFVRFSLRICCRMLLHSYTRFVFMRSNSKRSRTTLSFNAFARKTLSFATIDFIHFLPFHTSFQHLFGTNRVGCLCTCLVFTYTNNFADFSIHPDQIAFHLANQPMHSLLIHSTKIFVIVLLIFLFFFFDSFRSNGLAKRSFLFDQAAFLFHVVDQLSSFVRSFAHTKKSVPKMLTQLFAIQIWQHFLSFSVSLNTHSRSSFKPSCADCAGFFVFISPLEFTRLIHPDCILSCFCIICINVHPKSEIQSTSVHKRPFHK